MIKRSKKSLKMRWNLELTFLSGNRCRCGFLSFAVCCSSSMWNRRDDWFNNHWILMCFVRLTDWVPQWLDVKNLFRVQARGRVVGCRAENWQSADDFLGGLWAQSCHCCVQMIADRVDCDVANGSNWTCDRFIRIVVVGGGIVAVRETWKDESLSAIEPLSGSIQTHPFGC